MNRPEEAGGAGGPVVNGLVEAAWPPDPAVNRPEKAAGPEGRP